MSEPILAEEIAARLRREILRGNLPPGAPIKERDNAAEMGVSRTPMREAIRMLAKDGLVVLRPSRSPIVARPSFREIADQVFVLLALERLCAELACVNATVEDLEILEAINRRMADSYDHLDPLDFFEIDMEFHMTIARASHNTALAETHRAFLARLWRARFLSAIQRRNRDRVIGHHSSILMALKSRDVKAASKAINRHLGNLAEDIRPVIEEEEARQAS